MERTRNETPSEMYTNGSQIEIEGTVEDFSKSNDCINKDKLNRKISLKSEAFSEFTQNMINMKKHYTESNQQIEDLLNKLVELVGGKYQLKQISSEDLISLEKQTRKILLNHYSKCQELFVTGFLKLIKGIEQEKY